MPITPNPPPSCTLCLPGASPAVGHGGAGPGAAERPQGLSPSCRHGNRAPAAARRPNGEAGGAVVPLVPEGACRRRRKRARSPQGVCACAERPPLSSRLARRDPGRGAAAPRQVRVPGPPLPGLRSLRPPPPPGLGRAAAVPREPAGEASAACPHLRLSAGRTRVSPLAGSARGSRGRRGPREGRGGRWRVLPPPSSNGVTLPRCRCGAGRAVPPPSPPQLRALPRLG
ncbi:WAS/WASL-interacting protein family member 1-like [Melopsittacus undulatus]|uniref:WAS/WASL-interacting protein family member 1-like n=1 Tax=Melopsittacus undulatus TaxID=13146 RepID=UPI00146B53C7|nr:WAS/WASL-interacting protein family member 1-like [Melopsittacus undulatus]